jgi:hypothetical protein
MYWQKKEANDEIQRKAARLERTPFFSVRNSVMQKQLNRLHKARVF